jgi:hypothetical protein
MVGAAGPEAHTEELGLGRSRERTDERPGGAAADEHGFRGEVRCGPDLGAGLVRNGL